MSYALLGALLMVDGIAARIEAARHRSEYTSGPGKDVNGLVFSAPDVHYGWPSTTYDLVRIGSWALLVF